MFEVIPPTHSLRPQVEDAIRTAYRREHDARLGAFPWWLVAETCEEGVTCAASLRFADDGFFSEAYLDRPVEQAIGHCLGLRADRNALAEVGTLAAPRPGAVGPLVLGIITLLRARGTRWAIFTATARLRTLLRRTGIPLVELAKADPARVAGAESWGGYYRHDPRVMLVGDCMLVPAGEPRSRCGHA